MKATTAMQTLAHPLVLFELAGGRYGLPLPTIRECLRALSVVPLPKAPHIIEGVVNVRGAVVPVLDIRRRFRLPEKPLHPADHFLVAHAGERLVALRVDQVLGIADVAPGAIENAAGISPRAEYLAGVAKLPDGLVLIHDLGTFLSEAEARDLAEALDADTEDAS